MQKRTFLRTMLDILLENPVAKALSAFVKFCYEQRYYNYERLKFFENVPITKMVKENKYQNKFIFTGSAQYKIGTK